jgi:hypothetical protein
MPLPAGLATAEWNSSSVGRALLKATVSNALLARMAACRKRCSSLPPRRIVSRNDVCLWYRPSWRSLIAKRQASGSGSYQNAVGTPRWALFFTTLIAKFIFWPPISSARSAANLSSVAALRAGSTSQAPATVSPGRSPRGEADSSRAERLARHSRQAPGGRLQRNKQTGGITMPMLMLMLPAHRFVRDPCRFSEARSSPLTM